ncbi:alkaline phosphatase family protein [Lacipirellula limnantheis]|uniref:Phosphoglyceromutase n=1 Tax=Lacipirellula limnantheis TaxID=2528024 RepID=A0A517TYQ3_9BACT|nr:alkaline phosphatase family protein [Lacipirellula limnantheis]QDT73501.1 phosphoglyceromutase [Lacipirellula limnantheis]
MPRRLSATFTCAVVVFSFAAITPILAGERKVLTIAIDGLRPDALIAANAPNIDSLVDGTFFGASGPSGIFATYAQAEHLTFSGPGWGAYLTGLHVDRHGADTNEFENVVPGTTDWFTPLEAFDPSLNTHRALTWQIAHDSFPSGADSSINFEFTANGDQLMANHVVGLMQNPATDAVMTFFADVDDAGHTCGFDPGAACYLAEIANTDAQIGQIMNAMKSRPNFANEDWLVIITSDHGGLGTGHRGGLPPQRTIPFIVAGPLATTILPQAHPRLVDVAATVLEYFGAPIPKVYDGHAIGLAPAGPAPAALGRNLVFNGDAEYGRGFNQNSIQQYAAGWDDPGPGGVNTISYLAGGGFPSQLDPGPPDRGANFFSGGLNQQSSMSQRIDVSNLARQIDGGSLMFELSAWLGGYLNQSDSATVTARSLNAAGVEIAAMGLTAVTAADRGNATGLLCREDFGRLPPLTRFIDIVITASSAFGENDGYVDNISLELAPFGPPNGIVGDVNQDGVVAGNGQGPATTDDVTAFRLGWLTSGHSTASAAYMHGDLNLDRITDLGDWVILNRLNPAMGRAILASLSVPEPSGLVMLILAAAVVSTRPRRCA